MGQGQGRNMGQGGTWGRGKPALSFPPDQSQALGAWTGPVVLTGPAAGRRLASGPIYVEGTEWMVHAIGARADARDRGRLDDSTHALCTLTHATALPLATQPRRANQVEWRPQTRTFRANLTSRTSATRQESHRGPYQLPPARPRRSRPRPQRSGTEESQLRPKMAILGADRDRR